MQTSHLSLKIEGSSPLRCYLLLQSICPEEKIFSRCVVSGKSHNDDDDDDDGDDDKRGRRHLCVMELCIPLPQVI